jgi:hypothetical protein
MRNLMLLVVLVLGSRGVLGQPGGFEYEAPERSAPFSETRFEGGGQPQILVDGVWYGWVAIDGVRVSELARFVLDGGGDPEKRLTEDLVEWMGRFGQPLKERVTLTVVDGDGDEIELVGVLMTLANRNAARDARNRPRDVDAAVVLGELVELIEERHAYARLRGLDLEREMERELARLGEEPTGREVMLAAKRLVCLLGDGHATVRGWRGSAPAGWLGFHLAWTGEGVVAFAGDRSGFIDEAHPYVVSMDGVAIEEWVRAAGVYVAKGSEALVRRRSLDLVWQVNLVRGELGLAPSETIRVELRGEGGERVELDLPIAGSPAWRDGLPLTDSRELDGGVYYLRLSSMALDDEALEVLEGELDLAAAAAAGAGAAGAGGARGVIIDVRGNGGGNRDATRLVLQRLVYRLAEGDAVGARVVNVARARHWRSSESRAAGVLSNRSLHPEGWFVWSEAERAAIRTFVGSFVPEFDAGEGFGAWNYFVVSEPVGEEAKRINGPVVVLMDEGCFSATDIFLGGLKGVPGVTLVGMASSGGSARSRGHEVLSLGVEVRLASMVSYQPTGELYDGNGIHPDVVIERTAACVVGRADVQLDRAIETVRAAIED